MGGVWDALTGLAHVGMRLPKATLADSLSLGLTYDAPLGAAKN